MSSDSESDTPPDTAPLCVICDQLAVGVGPFSRCHLCRQHLNIDVSDAKKQKEVVAEELSAYAQDAANDVAAETDELKELLQEIQQTVVTVQRDLLAFCNRLTNQFESRLDAVRVCQQDLEDVESYKMEVATAENAKNIAEVVQLAESMQLSLPDLKSDFDRARRLRLESDGAKLQLRRLRQLERLVGSAAAGQDLADSATDTSCDSEVDVMVRKNGWRTIVSRRQQIDKEFCCYATSSFVKSHEMDSDGWVHWLAVCSDTSGFVGDRSGRVVPAESAGDGCRALSQPCIFAVLSDKEYLRAMSVDGSQMLRCHCAITFRKLIWGLHCDGQQLFIAQPDVVTVADLSGRICFYIKPNLDNFGDIWGIGGNAASVFVSSGNKIAAFDKFQFEFQYIITLSAFPDADLYNMACLDGSIFVADKYHNMVHRVSTDTQQLVGSYPTESAGSVTQFAYPYDVAIDARGRLFVSEFRNHSVRAVATDDSSLLWTLGVPGENGSEDGRLCCPCGLAVVTGGPLEQLIVADRNNKRLLVFNLD